MKPPHPQTRRPHAQITLSTSLYWRTRDSRKYSERAIQPLVSEVHKIEGGGPSSDHEQAAPTDWRSTNEDSQRGLQPGAEPQPEAQMFFQINSKASTCLRGLLATLEFN